MDQLVIKDPNSIRDLAPEVLGPDGRLRILPAAYWATTTVEERYLFVHRRGIYSIPTVELVEHLRRFIDGRSAIEVGAGHGVLAEALGIPATDNREQERPANRIAIALTTGGASPVAYGPNVEECAANDAVRKYKPEVVIGCWVTQNWLPGDHWEPGAGKKDGVDEEDIIRRCSAYVLVGNEKVHRLKKIWAHPHTIEYPPFVYSRAFNGSREFIATWEGGKR